MALPSDHRHSRRRRLVSIRLLPFLPPTRPKRTSVGAAPLPLTRSSEAYRTALLRISNKLQVLVLSDPDEAAALLLGVEGAVDRFLIEHTQQPAPAVRRHVRGRGRQRVGSIGSATA